MKSGQGQTEARGMKVAVTGASGAMGRAVVADLVGRGVPVIAMARSPGGTAAGVTPLAHDLLGGGDLTAAFREQGVTHLIHAAWITDHGTYWHAAENRDWQAATLRLAEQFDAAGGESFCFVGSCAEYSWDTGLLVEDVTPEEPATLYGQCKAATSRGLLAAGLSCRVSVGRVFHPFGPDETAQRVTSLVANALLAGEAFHLRSADVYRDLCSTRSVARCLVDLCVNAKAEGVVNIGSGRPVHLGRFLSRELGAGLDGERLVTWDRQDVDDPANPRVLIPMVRRLEAICPAAEYTAEDVAGFVAALRARRQG
jgi:nucleoside-diphosphate-sugar epimerase